MKKLISILCMGAALFLMGCPLMTNSPIKGESVKIPDWLTGRWIEYKDGAPKGTSYLLEALPSDPAALRILGLDDAGVPDKAAARTAVISLIKGRLFLSVYEQGDDLTDAGYYHYALGGSGATGVLELVPLKEHLLAPETSGVELATFIAAQSNPDEYLEKKDIAQYRRSK